MMHDTFVAFMESVVLPRQAANPGHQRLDGNPSGGNRKVAGHFRHRGKVWKVHADTHYEPLVLAYDAIKQRRSADPFREESTASGTCLVLTDEIRRLMRKPEIKHHYIYQA